MGLLCWIVGVIADTLDPVCQDKDAVLLGEHNGVIVRLRPVIEANGHIKEWVPDPGEAAAADACLAADPTPALPAPVPTPAPALPPPLPGGASASFNPAGVPGI
jgi:hypothetical protein